jgi:hypothetical protein
MIHEVIAKEHKQKLRVLSYQPGPLEGTDMSTAIIKGGMSDPDVQKTFNEMKYVGVNVSAKKLVGILQQDSYGNGSSIDFFD